MYFTFLCPDLLDQMGHLTQDLQSLHGPGQGQEILFERRPRRLQSASEELRTPSEAPPRYQNGWRTTLGAFHLDSELLRRPSSPVHSRCSKSSSPGWQRAWSPPPREAPVARASPPLHRTPATGTSQAAVHILGAQGRVDVQEHLLRLKSIQRRPLEGRPQALSRAPCRLPPSRSP